MSARPPADDYAVSLAIEDGIEVAETKLQTEMQLADDPEDQQYAIAALAALRKRQYDDRVGGDDL